MARDSLDLAALARAHAVQKERDAEQPKPSARFEGVHENARWNRIELDAFPALERPRELRLTVDRYDAFAAIWPDVTAPGGHRVLFLKGEDLAASPVIATLREGAILCDSEDHARGLLEMLTLWGE